MVQLLLCIFALISFPYAFKAAAQCTPGHYLISVGSGSVCTACNPGYWTFTTTATSCEYCQAGYYGSTVVGAAMGGTSGCTVCAPYQPHTTAGLSKTCVPLDCNAVDSSGFILVPATMTTMALPQGTASLTVSGYFKNCAALTSVQFAEGGVLRTIETSVFEGTNIVSITIPDSGVCIPSILYLCMRRAES